MIKRILPAVVLTCAPMLLAAQNDPHAGRATPTATAVRAAAAIHVDGHLDEAAWAAATPVTEFTQYDPDEGKPASEATEARILYDDEALYVGVRLHDRGHVNARLGRRDMDLSDADWFGVQIDSYHDHLTGFGFDVNPSGVRRDESKTDRGDDNSWDAVWESATSVDSGGWTAEVRIPFSQLRFNPRNTTWGLLLERIIGRRNEYAASAFTPKNERGGIARWGHLTGLRGIRTARRLELLPYTVARAEYVDPRGNPFRTDHEYGTRFGADVKYRVTSNLTLDATVNPDFGQVELDPAVVNLTQFETVFEERRPFFVEGRDIFNFNSGSNGVIPSGGSLFYSRRVGGLTSGALPPTSAADLPLQTRILGAAKLTGQTGHGWSIGVMDALTGRERARFVDDGGVERSLVSEPLTNFFVGRLKRDLRGGRTYVGAMVTAVNRDLGTPELRAALSGAGYSAGADFKHEFASRRWRVTGFGSVSNVRGDSLAILREQLSVPYHQFGRPDSHALRVDSGATSLSGFQGEMRVTKQAGGHWRGGAGVATITPGYEIADLGSQRRAARLDVDAGVTYLQQRPGPFFRTWQASLNGRHEWNYDGDGILTAFNSNGHFQHLSYWTADYSLAFQPRALDDRLTRGGPVAVRPVLGTGVLELASDARKPLVGSAGTFLQHDEAGGGEVNVFGSLELKVSPRWNLSVGPSFDRTTVAAQALGSVADTTAAALFGRRYLFTDLRQTTVAMDFRFNYTFNPDLTLQMYVAPFVSAVDFGDSTRYLVAPRTFDFATDHLSGVHPEDFNLRSLRGNAVLRWEWRPGSTLYVAWQQQREDFAEGVGDFSFGRDRAALFGTRPDNVFLVKVNYWLNP
jgi:hypothetical protein